MFRQTNVVWVAFTLGACLLDDLLALEAASSKQNEPKVIGREVGGACTGAGVGAGMGPGPGKEGGGFAEGGKHGSSGDGARGARRAVVGVKREEETGKGALVTLPIPPNAGAEVEEGGWGRSRIRCLGGEVSLSLLWGFAVSIAEEVEYLTLGSRRRGRSYPREGGMRAPLLLPLVGFMVFLVANGGSIVVGDAENHAFRELHLAQLAYLSAVTASLWGVVGGAGSAVSREALSGFMTFCGCRRGGEGWRRGRAIVMSVATVVALAWFLWRYSLAHPFLLSDNRHYTFYLWQRLLRFPAARSALAPAYFYCAWLVCTRLRHRKPPLWVLMYTVASALVLVPSPLLEPRYLTVPVLLAHLEAPERGWTSLLGGAAVCVAVNAITVGVFLARPFVWGDGSVARFMW
ncbi:unnamed protein product [Discosporangium mesarthrocarpum]